MHRLIGVALLLSLAGFGATERAGGGHVCITDRGSVITKLFRHRQELLRRYGTEALRPESWAALPDIGNIAVVDDAEGAVLRPVPFDLQGRTVRFTPSGTDAAQYRASPQPLAFDAAASESGTPLVELQDDDARLLGLPFSFPFYGRRYDSVYVNSDGNLTFTAAESASTPRTVSRAIAGPPRIFGFFSDLDPSRPLAAVRSYAATDRLVLTWDRVPEYTEFSVGRRQTFQIALYPDGRIEFHYREITISDAVVGIGPGQLRDGSTPVDFTTGLAAATSGAMPEVFSSTTDTDEVTISQKFYRNHDDAYDFIVVFNNMDLRFPPPGFAAEINVRNRVLGIGSLLHPGPVFDTGAQWGSTTRLGSFLNMGPLSQYPANPKDVIALFGASRNTTLSVMGQESGHRFLAYPRYRNPLTGLPSLDLLGRQQAHWSFFFNSDASVLEGNRIQDLGEGRSPRFITTATVERYNAFDQYLMGLRAASEVQPSFLVRSPSTFFSAGSEPQSGISFDGTRQDITVQMIIDAEGRRVPDSSVAQKHFQFAFVLLVREGTQPAAAELARMEALRQEWEQYFAAAVENRATAATTLVKLLRLSTWPAGGILRGTPGTATVTAAAPPRSDLTVLLSAGAEIGVPASVVIPAGRTSASFQITGNRQGVAELIARASDPAYETSRTLVQVREDPGQLQIEIVSGQDQRGEPGALLAEPIVLRVRDENDVGYSGASVILAASGDGVVTPARAVTDAEGRIRAAWRLASAGAPNTLRASLDLAPPVSAVVNAVVGRPAFAAAGVVNAASFNTGTSASNTAISAGGLVTIFGSALAAEERSAISLPLPTSLGGISVLMNGIPAPLIYASPTQINLQAPFELSGPAATIVISTPRGQSQSVVVPLGGVQPGIFFQSSTGLGAIVHNDDGKLTSERPARAGSFLQLYATGLGAVSPVVRSGAAATVSPLSTTVAQPQVTIAGAPAMVLFSGLAPGFAGLYQVTLQVPEGAPGGRQRVMLTINGLRSNEVFLVLE